jgi:hypothetical protein
VDNTGAATNLSIRVVLAELPALVAAIVRDAVRGGDIQIVDEIGNRAELSDVVARQRADVVIVPTEGSGVARQYHELLCRNPDLKILTIAAVSHSTDLYELRLLGNNIGQRGVVAAIRGVMGDGIRSAGESPPA